MGASSSSSRSDDKRRPINIISTFSVKSLRGGIATREVGATRRPPHGYKEPDYRAVHSCDLLIESRSSLLASSRDIGSSIRRLTIATTTTITTTLGSLKL